MQNSNGIYSGKEIGDYILKEELGRGSFGCVYKCQNKSDQSIHSIKIIEYKSLSFKGGIVGQLLKDEIHSLAKIDSPNVLKLEHYMQTKNRCYIVMEYCDSGDLYQFWIKQNRILDEKKVLDIIRQVLNGLKELHQNKIIHRDLKLANILLNKGQVKLADLGFCKMLNNDIQDNLGLGSPGTMAPEVINKESYGFQSDIFSIGCIFYQLLFGALPFNFNSKEIYLKEIDEQLINFKRNGVIVSENVKSIIQRMLVRNPQKRLTFPELYQFDLFKDNNQILEIQKNTKKDVQIQNKEQEDKMINNSLKEISISTKNQDQSEKTQFYNAMYQQENHQNLKSEDFTYVQSNNCEDLNQISNQKYNQNISQVTIKLNQKIKAREHVAPLNQDQQVLDKTQKNGMCFISINHSSSIIELKEYKQTLKSLKFCEKLYYELKETIQSDQKDLLMGRFMLLKQMTIVAEESILKIKDIILNQNRKDLILKEFQHFSSLEEFDELISNQKYNPLTNQEFLPLIFQGLSHIHAYLRDETNKEPAIAKKKTIAIITLKVESCVDFNDLLFSNIDLEEKFENIKKKNLINILKKIQS